MRGRVVTVRGTPLPDATVEVWGRGVVFHVTHTDADGRFSLPDPEGRQITRYVFRHVGYGVEIVQRDDFRDGMEVELPEPTYALEGLRISVSPETCPQDDEPEARELWTTAAAGYNRNTSRRGLGGLYEAEIGDLNERRLYDDLESELEADVVLAESWSAGRSINRGEPIRLEDVVREWGYAWRRKLDYPEYFIGRDRHLNWLYAALDTRSANHFATPTFGALHTFSLAGEDDRGTKVRFCPDSDADDHPSIEGTIRIAEDGEFVEAEWRFITPDPDEEAGGWVKFTTARDPAGGRPHLVVERGLFYRHNGFEKPFPDMPRWYFRELRAWSGWRVSTTDREPRS